MLIEGRERLIRCFRRKLFETRLYLETKYFEICYFSMFDFKSAEISEDGETFMPIMAPPGQISIECDQSDTDHVCLGPWLYNTVDGPRIVSDRRTRIIRFIVNTPSKKVLHWNRY